MNKIDINSFMHCGMVVQDLDKSLEKLKDIIDFNDYAIRDFPPEDCDTEVQLFYMGKKADFKAKFCFIKTGPVEIEIIQPVSGESVWADFLKENGDGIHHIKFEVDSINDTLKYYKEKGIRCLQYGTGVGPNLGKTWAYFDTVNELGYIIEVLNKQVGEIVDTSLVK